MTEREKIVEVLRDNIEYELRDYPDDHYVGVTFNYGAIADALIAANIGDVTKWKERAEKAENTLKEGVKCISTLQSAGFTINPIDVLRDSTECLTIAQRALFNMTKKYMLADGTARKIATTKNGRFSFSERLIALVANEAIKQAEREIEDEKND